MSSHQRVRLMCFNEYKYTLGEKHWVVGNVFRILTSLGLGLVAAQEELGHGKGISLSHSKRLSLVAADDVCGREWLQPEGLPSRPRNHAQPRLFVYLEKETKDFLRSQVIRRKVLRKLFECGCLFR